MLSRLKSRALVLVAALGLSLALPQGWRLGILHIAGLQLLLSLKRTLADRGVKATLLEELDLAQVTDRNVENLSGGERRRFQLLRLQRPQRSSPLLLPQCLRSHSAQAESLWSCRHLKCRWHY